MIQRGSDTSFTNLWSLLLYIQSLLHYIDNAQENKKNTILSYNIAENSKRIKTKWGKSMCVCIWMLDGCIEDQNIVFTGKSKRTPLHRTKNVRACNRTNWTKRTTLKFGSFKLSTITFGSVGSLLAGTID
jgi:hypothetical protein